MKPVWFGTRLGVVVLRGGIHGQTIVPQLDLGVVLVVVLAVLAGAVILGQKLLGGTGHRSADEHGRQSVPIMGWLGEYYEGTTWLANRHGADDAEIYFDWGQGAPTASLPIDNFSVRWTRSVDFESGYLHFYALSDDARARSG